ARPRRQARRARLPAGIHARRAAPRDAAPLRPVLGLPGDRLLRPAGDARRAGRPSRIRRRDACERGRRLPRLGPGALPTRRLAAPPVGGAGALRAPRPPPWGAPRL